MTICDKSGSSVGAGYRGLAIIGRSGQIDDSKSKMEVKPSRVPGGMPGKILKGLFFEPDTWDGSDLFMIGDALYVVVTQRVVDCLRRSKIKDLEPKKLTDFERRVFKQEDGSLAW